MGEREAAIQETGLHEDPADRWVIRPYRPGDEVQILDLFRRVFGVERSLEHWRWKFEGNPSGQYIRLAETPSEELVGQYAGLPVRMVWGEHTLVLTQIIDVMVDPHFRRGLKRPGLFAAIANRYIADYGGPGKVAGGYGFPSPEALRIGRLVAGYTPLHPVVALVKDLDSGRDPGKKGAWLYRVEEVFCAGDELDLLWQRCQPTLSVAIVRDARYINWRYVDCPDVSYRLLTARQRLTGRLVGVAVLRLGWGDRPVACLVDWLVPSAATSGASALLSRCEAMAREAGMRQLHAWFLPDAWPHRFLVERGYRLEPTVYHFVGLSTSPEVSLEWARTRWYYTMGDSDLY